MKKRHKAAQGNRRVTLKTSDLGKAKATYYNGRKQRKQTKIEAKDQLSLDLGAK